MKGKKSTTLCCPFCGSEGFKSLKAGNVTRCCGENVVRVNGSIYATLEDAPEWQLLQQFVELKRQHGSPHYEIPYGLGPYQENMRAVTILLDRCHNSVRLASIVLHVSFEDPRHSWRNHLNFFSIISKKLLPDALALAKELYEQEQDLISRQELFVKQTERPEWSDEYVSRLF